MFTTLEKAPPCCICGKSSMFMKDKGYYSLMCEEHKREAERKINSAGLLGLVETIIKKFEEED
jgi:hypothetical protein